MPTDAMAYARVPERCAHGVPLFGADRRDCIDCDIAWEEWTLAQTEKQVAFHRRKLEELKAAKAAQ